MRELSAAWRRVLGGFTNFSCFDMFRMQAQSLAYRSPQVCSQADRTLSARNLHFIMASAASRKKNVQAKMEIAGSADNAAGPAAVYHNPNLEWHEKIQLAVDAITGYYGPDLISSQPMKLSEGGFSEPLDMGICKNRYQDPGTWTDAVLVNCLWCSPTESATPNVQDVASRVNARAPAATVESSFAQRSGKVGPSRQLG